MCVMRDLLCSKWNQVLKKKPKAIPKRKESLFCLRRKIKHFLKWTKRKQSFSQNIRKSPLKLSAQYFLSWFSVFFFVGKHDGCTVSANARHFNSCSLCMTLILCLFIKKKTVGQVERERESKGRQHCPLTIYHPGIFTPNPIAATPVAAGSPSELEHHGNCAGWTEGTMSGGPRHRSLVNKKGGFSVASDRMCGSGTWDLGNHIR